MFALHVLGYRVESIVVIAAVVGLIGAVIWCALSLHRRKSLRHAITSAMFGWTLLVVTAVSLSPDSGRADGGACSFSLPDHAFWTQDQRLLNVLMYIPLAALAALGALDGHRRLWGLLIVGYLPVLIELLQRTDTVGRSCDLVDAIDNWAGALVGTAIGLGMLAVERAYGSSASNSRTDSL